MYRFVKKELQYHSENVCIRWQPLVLKVDRLTYILDVRVALSWCSVKFRLPMLGVEMAGGLTVTHLGVEFVMASNVCRYVSERWPEVVALT